MNKLILSITVFSLMILLGCKQITPIASMTFLVLDDDGVPVENAEVSASFHNSSKGKTKLDIKVGRTNSKGEFYTSGKTVGLVRYRVNNSGYYQSKGSYDFFKRSMFSWKPENPAVQVVLRKVKNPVPMYARDTRDTKLKIPKLDTDIGFDLVEFDWVSPYGRGQTSDFIFNLHREDYDRLNYKGVLSIKFSNQFDGMSEFNIDETLSSDFKFPYEARSDGYKDYIEISKTIKNGANQDYKKNQVNYFFRVRSEVDANKNHKAMYGKIHKGIDFKMVFTDTGLIRFKYYLNPDFSRNIEYDVMKNLFTVLSEREFVRIY